MAIAVAAIPPTKIAAAKAAKTNQKPSSFRITSAGGELSSLVTFDKFKIAPLTRSASVADRLRARTLARFALRPDSLAGIPVFQPAMSPNCSAP